MMQEKDTVLEVKNLYKLFGPYDFLDERKISVRTDHGTGTSPRPRHHHRLVDTGHDRWQRLRYGSFDRF